MKRNSRGFTLIELLVVIAIIALLMGLLLPALAKALGNARVRKDQGQIKGIAASYSIFGESDRKKQYPIPGMINREEATVVAGYNGVYQGITGGHIQGLGDPDDTINISGWLHSYMIGANYYGPEILVSSNENNPMVSAKGDEGANAEEIPYNFAMVDVASDTYWDPLFSGDITGNGDAAMPQDAAGQGGVQGVCHTSYTNLALCGKRLDNWRDGGGQYGQTMTIASRGPELRDEGDYLLDFFTNSPTLQLYGHTELWEGIFVAGDGSAHYANDMWFNNKEYTSRGEYTIFRDNGFMAEFVDYDNDDPLGNDGGASGDNFMVLNVESTKSDVRQVNDLLLP